MIDVKKYPLEQKIFSDMWSLFKEYADLGVLKKDKATNLIDKISELSKQYVGTNAEQFYTDMALALIDHISDLNRKGTLT